MLNVNNIEVRHIRGELIHQGDDNLVNNINNQIQSSVNYYRGEINYWKKLYNEILRDNSKLRSELAKKTLNIAQDELGFEECIDLLIAYKSPESETSAYKNIPMQFLNAIQKHFKGVYKYKYRGNSIPEIGFHRPSSHIPKDYATSFALYPTKGVK